MRIWTTFTAVILIIICSISVLYLFAFRKFNENARIHDLKVAHDILLESNNFNEPSRFDEFRNIKGSEHFIVRFDENNVPQIMDMNKRKGSPPPQMLDSRENMQQMAVGNEAKIRMANFIKGDNISDQQFETVYNYRKFNFIISSVVSDKSGRSYLVSYIPNTQDNSLLYMVILIGVIFIAIGFVTAKMVANRISKPLKELEDYTIKIANKDWKEAISISNEDEIGRLANAMNHMQRELKRADEEEKMFLQSISHDLKTPVMVIMSHAEAIVDGVYIDSIETTAEIIKNEAVSLEKKIKQLLYLNTLDYVLENNSDNIEIDLHRLLLHIINRFELINSKIDWNLDIDKMVINGNLDKIQVAIENILENGLRYAEEKICITLKQEEAYAILEIYNDGPTIDEKHIGHIFDNHYKDKTGNFGLGLAISKKIIDFYEGDITVVNRDQGVSFIIKFPM
jgi:two-component system sensor histidine kinase CssS